VAMAWVVRWRPNNIALASENQKEDRE